MTRTGELLGVERGARFLDLGCGSGGLARRAAVEHGCRAVGIDADVRALHAAREASAADPCLARFAAADMCRMPFADGAFDVVECSIALYYVEIRRGLEEIARVLRPGGVACVTIPLLTWGRITRDAHRGPRAFAYGLAHAANGFWLSLTGRQARNPLLRRDAWALYALPRSLERLAGRSPLVLEGTEIARRDRTVATMALRLRKPRE